MLAETDGTTNEPIRTSSLSKRPAFLPLAAIVGLTVLLSACGTGGSGSVDRDPNPPPEPDPVLSTTYTLSEGEHGSGTWFRYGYLRTTGGAVTYKPRVKVPESGTVTIEYDSREIEDELAAEEFFQYILPWVNGEPAAPVTISNPDVTLKSSSNLLIYQEDPADPDRSVISHNLYLTHNPIDDQSVWTVMRAVFAANPVNVRAEYATTHNDISVEIDLAAGWNLVYYEQEYIDGRWQSQYRAKAPDELTELNSSRRVQSFGPVDVPFDATYTSLFDAQTGGFLHLVQHPTGAGAKYLTVPTWLSPPYTDSTAISFPEYLGAPATTEISGAAGLQVLTGELRTYTQTGNWWDPEDRNGEIALATVEGGHHVALMYADRSAVIRLDNLEVADTTYRTPFNGLSLDFGWNYVAVVPETAAMDVLTLHGFPLGSDEVTLIPLAH